MAETADSLFRRGAISPKQAAKMGVLKKTKVERADEEDFDGKQGLKDQGGIRDKGIKQTRRDAINQNQKMGEKPSKGGSIKNGKGGMPTTNAINENTGKEWPSEKNASARTPENPRSKGKIAKQGGQYGGGGRDTQ